MGNQTTNRPNRPRGRHFFEACYPDEMPFTAIITDAVGGGENRTPDSFWRSNEPSFEEGSMFATID